MTRASDVLKKISEAMGDGVSRGQPRDLVRSDITSMVKNLGKSYKVEVSKADIENLYWKLKDEDLDDRDTVMRIFKNHFGI